VSAPAWELPRVIDLAQLGALGEPVSSGDGQSVSVTPLTQRPQFLFKQYKTPGDRRESVRLDELIRRPETVPAVTTLLRSSTSWPVARVNDSSGGVLGCIIPRAPESFITEIDLRSPQSEKKQEPGPGAPVTRRYLDVDLLAASPQRLARMGVRPPSLDERMTAVRSLVKVADSLEQLNLVYSDWSYSNAFWSPREHAVYVIDVDGCAVGSGANIFQPNWEDPLTPQRVAADTYVERYRVALLTARCLTSERAIPNVVARLQDKESPVCGNPLREVLLDMMLMSSRGDRPSVSKLLDVLEGSPYIIFPGRLRLEVPVPPPKPLSQPVFPVAPRPPASPASPAHARQRGLGRRALILALLAMVLVLIVVVSIAIAANQ
jgi:hypothetical protein